MAKSYNSIKAGWKNPNSSSVGKRKSYKDIKASDYDFGVDESYIESFINDSQKFITESRANYNKVGYKEAKSAYEQNQHSAADLRDRASTIKAYFNANKGRIQGDYSSLMEYLDDYGKASEDVLGAYRGKQEYFSQWADEDSYNRDYDHYTYSQKYAKSTYADLQKAKTDIQERLRRDRRASSDELNRELHWLENHDTDAQFVDSMSNDDLTKLQNQNSADKKALQTERAELIRKKAKIESQANGRNVSRNTEYNTIVDRINEIDKELETVEDSVLYYDNAGAITVDDVLRDREHDATFNAIEGNWAHKKAYENALKAQENIVELDAKEQELQKQLQQYQKVGTVPDSVVAEINGIEAAITEQKAIIERFDALGYNFEELQHYNRRKESRANYVAEQKKDSEYASAHPVKATFKSILNAPASIVELTGNLVDTAQYGYSNVYDDEYIRQNQAYQSTVADMIDTKVMEKTDSEVLAWLASGAYSGVTSSAQSAMTTAACTLMFGSAGPSVALGIMGTEAAASSYNNAIMNGSTNGEAILTATASGIAEALFEKVSLDSLIDIGKMYDVSSLSALLKSMLKNSGATFAQGLTEASEELCTEIANMLADEIINGDHSAYNTAISKYKKMGYSDTDAKDIASRDALNDILTSFYGGFIGGVGSGAGASVAQGSRASVVAAANTIATNDFYNRKGEVIVDRNNVSQLVEEAKSLGNSKLNKLANVAESVNTEELSTKDAKKYAHQVGKLYKGVQQAQFDNLSKTSETAFRNVIKAEVEKTGVADVDATTDILVKVMRNKGLTRAENRKFQSVNGRSVLDKVINSAKFDKALDAETKKQYTEAFKKVVNTNNLGKDIYAETKAELIGDKYTLSSDDKITIDATDENVDSMVITSLDGKDITLDVVTGDKHQTVVAGELRLNEDYAVILEGLRKIKKNVGLDETTANNLLTLWDRYDGDALDFYKGIESSFMYGNYNMRDLFEKSNEVNKLPENIRNDVYKMGEEYRQKVTDEKTTYLEKQRQKRIDGKKGKVRGSGNVKFDGVKYKDLNASQKAQVDLLEVIFSEAGINLEFFASPVVNGKHVGENGSYNSTTRTIRIDVFAGNEGGGLMLYTAAHELTHFIREWSPSKFKVFADFLIKRYAETDVPLKSLIQAKFDNAKILGKKMTYDLAYEEVVADACESFLRDSNAKDALVALAQVDESLHEKIIRWIKDFVKLIEKAINALNGQEPESEAATHTLNELKDDLSELHDMWDAALFDAIENSQWVESSKVQKNTTVEGDVKQSIQAKLTDNLNPTESDDIRYQDREIGYGKLTQERIDDLIAYNGAGSRVDYANAWIATIDPSQFIDLTLPYETRVKDREVFDKEVQGDHGNVMGERDYIADLKNSSQMPRLRVDIDTGKVIGHDGRHRMRALEMAGASRTPVEIIFYKDGSLYKGNNNGVRLESIDSKRLISQFDDKSYLQTNGYIHDIIPLNEDHRAEIEKEYRVKALDLKYGKAIAYQDRPYQPSPEDLGVSYKAENDKLKADVDRLNKLLKLQRTLTHGALFTKTSVDKAASLIMKEFGLHRGKSDLSEKLNALYTFVASSNDLTWDEFYDRASQVANWIIDSKPDQRYYKNPYASEVLKNIRERGITLNEKQKEEAAYYAGSLNAYCKSNIGNFRIVNEGGISLTELWEQLVEDYPGAFSQEDIEKGKTDTNLPSLIVEVIGTMRQTESVLEQMDRTQEVRKTVEKIYDTYWNVTTLHTLADKHQKEVNLLKGKHRAEMDALKEKGDENLKQAKERYREMLQKVREDKDAKMTAYKEHVAEQRHKSVEGRQKTATKNKIKRVVQALASLYNNPTKERNVKVEFQDMVDKALVMADAIFNNGSISVYDILSSDIPNLRESERKDLEKWRENQKLKAGYQRELDELEASEKLDQATHDRLLKGISECNRKLNYYSGKLKEVIEVQRGNLNDHAIQNATDSLVSAYKSLNESTEGYAQAAYNEYVDKRLVSLKEALKNTTIKTMTQTQLDELYQAYKMVLTTVRKANELFIKNKKMSVADAGETVMREVQNVAKVTENKVAMKQNLNKFMWEELKPVYAFERIGSETFMNLYKEILRGQSVFGRDIDETVDFFQRKSKAYNYDSWDLDERRDFKLVDGRTFTISLQEIMSIYAYSKREQALDHITKGGFVFDSNEFFTDNKEKGIKGKIKKVRTTVEAYRLNDETFYRVINSLTPEQKKFVDDMQDYLSTVMGAKGNEVSRELYGIDLFREKYYFPLMSSHDFIQQTNNPAGEVALKNSGMAKATVPHARNPIILKGFMDVWSEHVNKMSTYHAFVLPIENLNKVFNYTGYATDNKSVSVQTILNGAYGPAVNQYITTLLQDLNGGIKVQGSGNWVTKGISLFKKTAVAASTSVVIQQPTAIVRALAMIDGKYFVHGRDGLKHNEAWDELKKYAPIAVIKEMGGFDVGGGKQVAEYITAKSYKGLKKVGGFFKDSKYRDEALMWGASKADEFGWITIWSAVKKEIADTTTYKVGSEEFLQACGERFTEVVDYTQVYDSVLSRSGFMRNKGEISKMATSFMGEPTTSFNMLYNAVLQLKRGNISKLGATKIVGATMASIIFAAIAKSLIYALRDDDEDEAYAEKYAQALTDSLKSDLFIPNMLPYVSDITSLFSGWDVERTDMAILKDLKDAIDGLDSSSKSPYRKIEDLAGAIAAFGGIPLKNVMRTTREMYNAVANIFDGNTSDFDDVGDAVVESFVGETTTADVNKALEKGNTAKAKEIINDLVAEKVESGKTEKEAKASVKASVTSYWKGLYLQAYRNKDNAEMLRIRRILQATGLYDDVLKTCSNWIKGMKNETTDTGFTKW